MNKLSKKPLSYPNHGKVHGFQSKNISGCQVKGLRFPFLVPEKWRQEESHKFEVSVVYIARHSSKQNRKPGEMRNVVLFLGLQQKHPAQAATGWKDCVDSYFRKRYDGS